MMMGDVSGRVGGGSLVPRRAVAREAGRSWPDPEPAHSPLPDTSSPVSTTSPGIGSSPRRGPDAWASRRRGGGVMEERELPDEDHATAPYLCRVLPGS